MSSGFQEPQTNQATGQPEERLLEFREAIQATPQPPEGMQPRDGPLHEPTELPQAAAMLPIPLTQNRRDAQPAQQLPHWTRVVAAVALQPLRLLTFGTGLATHGRHTRQHLEDLRHL